MRHFLILPSQLGLSVLILLQVSLLLRVRQVVDPVTVERQLEVLRNSRYQRPLLVDTHEKVFLKVLRQL